MNREDEKLIVEEKLPKKAKIAFGSSISASYALNNIALTPITFYYNIKLGLSAYLLGIAWLIFAIWNAINDPIFGIMQDRTRTKLGRRIPYIRYGAPILGLFFVLMWIPLVDPSSEMALFLNFLIMLFLFDTISTLIGLALGALSAEMAFSSKERASMQLYSNLLVAIATGVSFVLPLVLLTGDESTTIHPLLYPSIIILAVICSVVIYICSYYLKEYKFTQMEEPLKLKEGIKETFKNKPFLINILAVFFATIANTIFLTAFYYYIDYIILLSGFFVIIPLLIVFGMVIIFAILLNPLLNKYGTKKIYIMGFLLAGFGSILLFFVGYSLIPAILVFMLIGFGFAAISILASVVTAETFDYDEIRTGKRRETTYNGIGALFTRPSVSIANWLFLSTITAFGFIEGAAVGDQPPSASMGIMVSFTLLSAIFLFLSALVMKFFPLDGPKWQAEKVELKKIHDKKEEVYQEYLREMKTEEQRV